MVANAQKQLNLAIEWGAQNGLSFCPDKTTVVFFTRKYNFHKRILPKVKQIKMGGVEIKPSASMTYLGIILDQKLNWSLHIKTKVSKAIKWLAILKPANNYIWRTTPTASLEVILNKKPAHLEVLDTAIKTYMRIKDQFQNIFWDGMPLDNRSSSHLRKLNQITSQIYHEDQSLDNFTSEIFRTLTGIHLLETRLKPRVQTTLTTRSNLTTSHWLTPSLKTTLTMACHLMMETSR